MKLHSIPTNLKKAKEYKENVQSLLNDMIDPTLIRMSAAKRIATNRHSSLEQTNNNYKNKSYHVKKENPNSFQAVI